MGNFSTRSLIISKDALPEPTMIPALMTVSGILPAERTDSTFLRDFKWSDNSSSLAIPPK